MPQLRPCATKQINNFFKKERRRDIETDTQREDNAKRDGEHACNSRGTDWSATSPHQGMPGTATHPQEHAEGSGQFPSLRALEGSQPCQHLDLRLLASRT